MRRFQEAVRADKETKERVIQALASHPQETLPVMIDVLRTPQKFQWGLAIQVIRAIGYPQNRTALPYVIEHLADGNSPIQKVVVQMLNEMEPEVVVPHLIQFLLDPTRHYDWEAEVQEICCILWTMKQAYIDPCGPTVAHLLGYFLGRDDFRGKFDSSYFLDILEKIGPPCASYALPVLISVINHQGSGEVGLQARQLIASFEREDQAPYQDMLAAFGIAINEGQK